MKINPLPAFAETSIGLRHYEGRAPLLDGGDTQPVLRTLEHDRLQLAAILVTQHPSDHPGGVQAPKQAVGAKRSPGQLAHRAPFIPIEDGYNVTAPGIARAVIDADLAVSAALCR